MQIAASKIDVKAEGHTFEDQARVQAPVTEKNCDSQSWALSTARLLAALHIGQKAPIVQMISKFHTFC